MEIVGLLHEKNYLSHVPNEIFNRIFMNLDAESNMKLCFVSTKFYHHIHDYIPPLPINVLYSMSNQIINYIDKLELCKLKYEELEIYSEEQNLRDVVPKYVDYMRALEILPNAKLAVPYSIYFRRHDGHERINKLCKEETEMPTGCRLFYTSYFRDPYALLVTILLLSCVTIFLCGIITHTVVTFNETARKLEEDNAYSLERTNNLNLIQLGQHSNLNPRAANRIVHSGTFPSGSRQNCYKSLQSYENDIMICFASLDELCRMRAMPEKYLEYLLKHFYGRYSAPEIRDIYHRLANYVCEHNQILPPEAFFTGYNLTRQTDAFKIGPPVFRNCMLLDGSLKLRSMLTYRAFYVASYMIDAECIADEITVRPHLHNPIWPFIVTIAVMWAIFLMCACFAIIIV